MTLRALKAAGIEKLKSAQLPTPGLDTRILLLHISGWEVSDLIVKDTEIVPQNWERQFHELIDRRIAGEPIDHILGYSEFYGRAFKINQDVLSPRPETEGLVDQALKFLKPLHSPNILDLGTGTGAILITLLSEHLNAIGVGVDVSERALCIAKQNGETHQLSDRTVWLESNWFEKVDGTFDLIISNPPYIDDSAMNSLHVEVKLYDPDIALRGGKTGLDAYKTIISNASEFLNPGGALMFEIGFDQGKSVTDLLKSSGFKSVKLFQDLSGHDRVITASLGG